MQAGLSLEPTRHACRSQTNPTFPADTGRGASLWHPFQVPLLGIICLWDLPLQGKEGSMIYSNKAKGHQLLLSMIFTEKVTDFHGDRCVTYSVCYKERSQIQCMKMMPKPKANPGVILDEATRPGNSGGKNFSKSAGLRDLRQG